METVIVRTNGVAVEGTKVSKEITTYSTAREYAHPLRIRIGYVRANFSTAKTIDVHIVHDRQGAVGDSYNLQDDDVWIEAHVPSSGSGQTVIYNDRMATAYSTPANQATSTEAWTTTGITNPVYQKCSITTAGSEGEGWATVYLCVAKPSITLYACTTPEVA